MILTLEIAINAVVLVAWLVGTVWEVRQSHATCAQLEKIAADTTVARRKEAADKIEPAIDPHLREQYERLGLGHLLK